MTTQISEKNNGGEQRPPFNRSKAVRIVISILVAIAMWVYVDMDKACLLYTSRCV